MAGIRLPTSADVDVVNRRSDPGVAVPKGTFQSPLGIAAQELAPAFKELHKAEIQNDTLMAEDAMNQYRASQIDQTVGQEGFTKNRGKDVVNTPFLENYEKRLAKSKNDIAATLANDNQREIFERRSQIPTLQYTESLKRHIAGEQDNNAKEILKSTLAIELSNVSNNYSNPLAIEASKQRNAYAIDQEAARSGWSKERMDLEKRASLSSIHTSVISNALANDQWQYAQQYYRKNKVDIADPNGSIARALEEGGLRSRSQANADSIVTQYRDLPEALEAARKIKDPKLRDATEDRVRRQIGDRKQNDIRLQNAVFIEAVKTVEQTGDVDRIDPARYAELGPDQRNALKSLAERQRSGQAAKQNDEVWLKFTSMAPGAIARMDEAELITNYKPHLSPENWDTASRRWQAARNAAMGKPEHLAKIKDELTFEQRFADTMKSSGLLPKDKTIGALKGDNAAMVAKLRQSIADDIVSYKRSTGKDYIPPEETQRLINKHVMRTAFVDSWWTDPEKPITLLTPEEREKAYVPVKKIPPQDIVKIKNYARSMGVNISNRQMERAYFLHISGGTLEEYNRVIKGDR